MKPILLIAAIFALAATPGNARKVTKRPLPPVPQSAEIAALNKASLAKIAPVAKPATR